MYYLPMVTDGNSTYHGDYFEMYRNTESPCCTRETNIVLYVNDTSKMNKFGKKKIRCVVARGRGLWERELDEGNQKVQSFSYKKSKY